MQVFIALQVKHGNLPALLAHTTHSTIQHFWSNVHIQNTDFFLLLSTFHVPIPSNGLTDGCLSSPGLRGNPPQNKTKPKPTSQLKHLRLDGRSVSLQDNPKPGQVSTQWRTLSSLQGRSQYSEGHSGCLNPCLCVVQSSELVFSVLFYETVEEKINLSKKTYIWVTGRGRLWRIMTNNLEWIQQMCFCGSPLRLMFLGARALNVSTFTSLRPLSY